MAHFSSEIQYRIPNDVPTSSETSTRSLLYDHTSSEDSDLRTLVEEKAFQALSEGTFIKRPRYTFCVSEPDEDSDFFSLTFPKKLWKIVESDQFRSIWWDETGTSIVINEELFKREILERKAPFRIFETESMKSLVRQLNLYGFSKIRQNFQRSASLADFLAEEKEVSTLNKLQFYHNPNFKRGCPQLLIRMKRRVAIKNASAVPAALVHDFNTKLFRRQGNVDHQNSGLVAKTSGEDVFPASINLNVPVMRKPSTIQSSANTAVPIRSSFSLPSLTFAKPTEQMVTEQHTILNDLTTFPMHSQSSHTHPNGHIVNFVTTAASTSQYIISPMQNSYFGLMMEPSTLPTSYPALSANETPFSNALEANSPWLPVAMTTDTSATHLSRLTHQPSSSYQHNVNYN